MNNKKIRANLNPDVEIFEKDKNAYHFSWVSVKINPADPTHPVRKTEIRAIRKSDYRAFFANLSTEQLIRRMKIIGVEEVALVHDPTRPIESNEKIIIQNFSKVEVKEITDEQKIKEGQEAELKTMQEKATRTRSSRVKPKPMQS
jgi:hypothetical protein